MAKRHPFIKSVSSSDHKTVEVKSIDYSDLNGLSVGRRLDQALDREAAERRGASKPTRDPQEASDGFTNPADEEAAVQDECDRARE